MPVRTVLVALLLLSACDDGLTEVDHPFYLHYWENGEVDLIRCPNGPGGGCAVDGLPENVLAAGANKRFVVARTITGYFYFARVPHETGGWGNDPERIVGPLTAEEFAAAKSRLQLPDPTVRR